MAFSSFSDLHTFGKNMPYASPWHIQLWWHAATDWWHQDAHRTKRGSSTCWEQQPLPSQLRNSNPSRECAFPGDWHPKSKGLRTICLLVFPVHLLFSVIFTRPHTGPDMRQLPSQCWLVKCRAWTEAVEVERCLRKLRGCWAPTGLRPVGTGIYPRTTQASSDNTQLCRIESFPDGARSKVPACQCRRCKRHGFDPWVRKIPWKRAWQPIPVFMTGECHGQRSLAG